MGAITQFEAGDLRPVILEANHLAQIDIGLVVITVLVIDGHLDLQHPVSQLFQSIVVIAIPAMVDRLVLPQRDIAAAFIHVQAEHDVTTGVFADHVITIAIELDDAAIGSTQPRQCALAEAELEAALADVLLVGARVDRQFEQVIAADLGIADHRLVQCRIPRMPGFIIGPYQAHFTLRRAAGANRFVHHDMGAIAQFEAGDLRPVILEANGLAYIDIGLVVITIVVVDRHLDLQDTIGECLQGIVIIAIGTMLDRFVLP